MRNKFVSEQNKLILKFHNCFTIFFKTSYLEDKKLLRIVLQKRERNASNCWKSLLDNNDYAVDPFTFQEMEKKLTLERFQREVSFIYVDVFCVISFTLRLCNFAVSCKACLGWLLLDFMP